MLESVLSADESIITYRRRYRSQAQLETMLDLIVLDDANPRSLTYQLDRLTEDIELMPPPAGQRLQALLVDRVETGEAVLRPVPQLDVEHEGLQQI